MEKSNLLHITVGATPRSNLDFTQELNLIKVGILYADKVKLCSISSSMALMLSFISSIEEDSFFELVVQSAEGLNRNQADLRLGFELYRNLRKKKRRSKEELLRFRKAKEKLESSHKEIKRVAEGMLEQTKATGIISAIESGLVDLRWFDFNKKDVAKEFYEEIAESILSGETYPLLDDLTSDLIRVAIKEGKLIPLGNSISRAKQTGLASGLLNKLPLFEQASVDEIIDIRKELEKPLIRFRSAIIEFSASMANSQWDNNFSFDVEQIYLRKVEPAVLDIEEAVKSNKLLLEIIARSVGYGIAGSSALGILLSQANQFPEIIGPISAVAGMTIGAYEVVKKHRERKEEIQRNQLYFYYQVGKSLKG